MKNQCFLKMFAGFLFLLLLSGCGGQPAESDNSADVLARIQAGATPLTPPPTKEVILEARKRLFCWRQRKLRLLLLWSIRL